MSIETSVETWPAVPAIPPYESARPRNDRLMRRLATAATVVSATIAIVLVGVSAVLLGLS
jgi:hypothetical protein